MAYPGTGLGRSTDSDPANNWSVVCFGYVKLVHLGIYCRFFAFGVPAIEAYRSVQTTGMV